MPKWWARKQAAYRLQNNKADAKQILPQSSQPVSSVCNIRHMLLKQLIIVFESSPCAIKPSGAARACFGCIRPRTHIGSRDFLRTASAQASSVCLQMMFSQACVENTKRKHAQRNEKLCCPFQPSLVQVQLGGQACFTYAIASNTRTQAQLLCTGSSRHVGCPAHVHMGPGLLTCWEHSTSIWGARGCHKKWAPNREALAIVLPGLTSQQCASQQRRERGSMHSGRWGSEADAWEPPRSVPNRQNGRYVPDVDELDYTSAPRYHEVRT